MPSDDNPYQWQRTYVSACAAVVGCCVAYVACDFGDWPRLTYFQFERVWRWTQGQLSALPSNYVGTVFWGAVGGCTAGIFAWVGCYVLGRPISHRWLRLWGAWAITAFLVGGLYYTWNLWPFL